MIWSVINFFLLFICISAKLLCTQIYPMVKIKKKKRNKKKGMM